MTEDVNRQVEREKVLQKRYGELQEKIEEIQESQVQAQQQAEEPTYEGSNSHEYSSEVVE